mmetsp:Transcript_21635/g.74311  ORF Transcript_21635/g.74311 Transcript_21635/m.74311 type:complete len:274 (+) Transcript_21635:2675-3496(+)
MLRVFTARGHCRYDDGLMRVRPAEASAQQLGQPVSPEGNEFGTGSSGKDAFLQGCERRVDLRSLSLPLHVVLRAVNAVLGASEVQHRQAPLSSRLAAHEDAAAGVGSRRAIMDTCCSSGSQLGSHLDQCLELAGIGDGHFHAGVGVDGAIGRTRQVAWRASVQHIEAMVTQKLNKGNGNHAITRHAEQVCCDPVVDRTHGICLAASCLPVAHQCPVRPVPSGCADKLSGGRSVNVAAGDLLVEHFVERELDVAHEHVPHVRLHPRIVHHSTPV